MGAAVKTAASGLAAFSLALAAGGTAVKLGDAVEGGRVSAIREDHIVISGKGGRRTVYLLEQPIRNKRGR